MKTLKYILPIIFLIVIGCNSPVDIVTPRKKIITNPTALRVQPVITSQQFEENGSTVDYTVTNSNFIVDTTVNPPVFWLQLAFEAIPDPSNTRTRLQLGGMEIKVDSFPINGIPFQFLNYFNTQSYSKFLLLRGLNCKSDTSMFSGQDKNLCEMTISIDKQSKKIWSQFYTKIYNYDVWKESRDTIVKDTVGWNGNEPIIKELKLTIEQEMRKRDSLFIRGKFDFQY